MKWYQSNKILILFIIILLLISGAFAFFLSRVPENNLFFRINIESIEINEILNIVLAIAAIALALKINSNTETKLQNYFNSTFEHYNSIQNTQSSMVTLLKNMNELPESNAIRNKQMDLQELLNTINKTTNSGGELETIEKSKNKLERSLEEYAKDYSALKRIKYGVVEQVVTHHSVESLRNMTSEEFLDLITNSLNNMPVKIIRAMKDQLLLNGDDEITSQGKAFLSDVLLEISLAASIS